GKLRKERRRPTPYLHGEGKTRNDGTDNGEHDPQPQPLEQGPAGEHAGGEAANLDEDELRGAKRPACLVQLDLQLLVEVLRTRKSLDERHRTAPDRTPPEQPSPWLLLLLAFAAPRVE